MAKRKRPSTTQTTTHRVPVRDWWTGKQIGEKIVVDRRWWK